MAHHFSTSIDKLKNEVRIEYYKSSGPGGQHRNKTETAIRLVHLPSGVVVRCCDTRSQTRNREIAFERLASRLRQLNRPKKKRIDTRPTRASRERTKKAKQQRSAQKNSRQRVRRDGSE